MTELAPLYLIAVPQLTDPNFARSVVLILQHNAEGTYGLVVNNPTEVSLGTFARSQGLSCHQSLEGEAVFRGGPVEPTRGCILHSDSNCAERQEIIPGLYVSHSAQSLRTLLQEGRTPLRLIVGYAGWGPGQLEKEMAHGGWLTTEATIEYALHTPPRKTWQTVLSHMGIDPVRLARGGGIH